MGFTEVLTVVFIVLKFTGLIDWKWGVVLLPEIIAIAFYVVPTIILNVIKRRTWKNIFK